MIAVASQEEEKLYTGYSWTSFTVAAAICTFPDVAVRRRQVESEYLEMGGTHVTAGTEYPHLPCQFCPSLLHECLYICVCVGACVWENVCVCVCV